MISVLFGTAEAFYRPAVTALLPQTVPEAEIQEANALTSMSNNVGEFVGPALATLLVLGAGAGTAFALDAATFLVSAAVVIRLHPRRRAAGAGDEQQASSGWREELRAGFAEVRSRTWVWATLLAFCVAVFIGLAPWYVLGPLVATEQYGGLAVYGVVAATFGAGTIVGSLIGIRWRPLHPMRMAMVCVCLLPISQIVYAAGVSRPARLSRRAGRRHRAGAVRRLVDHRPGRADPARTASRASPPMTGSSRSASSRSASCSRARSRPSSAP